MYNLPPETEASPSFSDRKKRPSSQLNKDRSVSHGLCWEYEDEGDVGYQDSTAFQESAPKRRKSAPPKRSKSMKLPEPTHTQFWELGEVSVKAQQVQDLEVREQNSQLTTPPDSGKRIKSRAKSAISKSKPKQTSLFQKPTITKPLASRSMGSNQEPRSYAVINQQGWATTEDAVKLNSNGITKTTLEKLALFRCNPSSYDHDTANSDSPKPKYATGRPDSGLQQDHSIHPGPSQPSSDYDLLPSNDSFFKEAMWNAKISTDPLASDLMESERPYHVIHDAIETSNCRSLEDPQVQPDLLEKTNNSGIGLEIHEPSFFKEEIPHGLPAAVRSSQWSEYGEPTSSEAVILNGLMKDVDIIDLGERGVNGAHDSPLIHELKVAALQQEVECDAEGDEATYSDVNDNSRMLDAEAARTDELEELPQHQQQINAGNAMIICRRRSVAQIQVERSDTDDYEAVDHQGSKDLYAMDEFDEGLEDDEFLAMVSEMVVPETPLKVHSQQQNGEKSASPAPTTFLVVPAPLRMGHIVESADALPKSKDIPIRIPSPRIFTSESDDEFPMDQGDEEEMLKLPELANGVEENFTAPAGISLSSGDELDIREVYDPSLQHSPPTSRSGQSPKTAAYNRHTDRNSANQSPNGPSEIDQVVMEHEEDWTFIRTGHGEARMPDPFIDPPQPTAFPQRPGPQRQLLSSQILQSRSISAGNRRTHSSATQTASDITWSIIDDSREYLKVKPFARPNFPSLVPDRCPVIGISAQTFLRTCFRVGEMFKEGARRNALGQDVVIELFARVTFSSRDTGSKTQHFQFADLWHDRPPFPSGILADYKTTELAESESRLFLEPEVEKIARCLGRLKRDIKSNIGWVLHIINIRTTDWEEIRFTKNAVSRELVKSETVGFSKL